MANNNNKLKAFVRYDGSGRVIPSSLILQRFKPKVGNWVEINANECCNYVPITTTTTTTAASTTTTTTTAVQTTTTTTTAAQTTTTTTTSNPEPFTFQVDVEGGAYIINGEINPTLNLVEGQTYLFNINASGHPFWIKTVSSIGTGNQYNTGVTNNGTQNGTITFVVPIGAPSTLYYNCQYHSGMAGVINITP